MLQSTPDGKAIWRATVTSSTGWTHSFTLLRLAPALIWESGERPAPFAGMVTIDAALAGEAAGQQPPFCGRRGVSLGKPKRSASGRSWNRIGPSAQGPGHP